MFLAKSKEYNRIFGGWTDIPLQVSGGRKKGKGNSFLFAKDENNQFLKIKCFKP